MRKLSTASNEKRGPSIVKARVSKKYENKTSFLLYYRNKNIHNIPQKIKRCG